MIRVAVYVGAIDKPNERKVHKKPVPRLGGFAIFSSFVITLGIFSIFYPGFFHQYSNNLLKVLLVSSTFVAIVITGILDDIKPLRPGPKFLVQIAAATLIYVAGFRISALSSPLGLGILHYGYLDYPLTVLWIVGITNALNLIDGLDGLAAGIAVIAASTIFIISIANGEFFLSIMILIFIGSILGFLWYNFHPAEIFMGDSGSLFLGFALAILSIQSSAKQSMVYAILVPALALGLPIIDTLIAMTRRFLSWFMPQRYQQYRTTSILRKLHSIFLPDRSHIHHKLIEHGVSHRNTVLLLYFVSILFGASAVILTLTKNTGTSAIVFIAFIGIALTGIRLLQYKEMAVFTNGVFLLMYKKFILNNRFLQAVLDFVFVVASFLGAHYVNILSGSLKISGAMSYEAIIVLCGIQYGVFLLGGLYKESISRLGIADVVRIIKTTAAAAIASGLILYFLVLPDMTDALGLFILDFYFLLTSVLGMRISFHILNYLFHRYQVRKQKVLIYGANKTGIIALQTVLSDEKSNLVPIGFLDDDASLEGHYVNGFPIFGGHWKIPRLIRTKNIKIIILTSSHIKPEILRRIKNMAEKKGVSVHKMNIQMEEMVPEKEDNHIEQEHAVTQI